MKSLGSILVLTTIFLFISCDDSGVVKTNENNSADSCITATLSGWVPGSNRILKARVNSNASFIYVLAGCPVENSGSFNLCFPNLLDSTLYPADSIFYTNCTGNTVTFDPPDVKGTMIYNYRVYQSDSIVGAVDCNTYIRSDSIKAGDFEVHYIYVNKPVTVTGYKVCGDDTLKFNGSAVQGWNKIIKHFTRVQGTSRTMLYDMSEPPGAVWEYHGD
jgi:hypothetical protein